MVATIILLFLFFIDLLLNAHYHGKKKKGSYNFWISLLAVIIYLFLYYKAGIFNNFKF